MEILNKSVLNKKATSDYIKFMLISVLLAAYILYFVKDRVEVFYVAILIYIVVILLRTRKFLNCKKLIKNNEFKILQSVVSRKTIEGSDEDLYYLHLWCGDKYGSKKIQVNYKEFGAAKEKDLYYLIRFDCQENNVTDFIYPCNKYSLDYELKGLCPYTDTYDLKRYVAENPPMVPIIDFDAIKRQSETITEEQRFKVYETGVKNKKYLWAEAILLPVSVICFIVFFCVFNIYVLSVAVLGFIGFITSLVMSKKLKEKCEIYSYPLYCFVKDRIESEIVCKSKQKNTPKTTNPKNNKLGMVIYSVYKVIRKIILYILGAMCLIVIASSLSQKPADVNAIVCFGIYLTIIALMLYTDLRHLWLLCVSVFFIQTTFVSFMNGQKETAAVLIFLIVPILVTLLVINLKHYNKKKQ